MKLEDVFLYLILKWRDAAADAVCAAVRGAVQGGTDMIQVDCRTEGGECRGVDDIRRLVEVCREEDALIVVCESAELAAAADADGVHVPQPELPLALARAVVGPEKLVGVSSYTPNQAALALELEPDYLLHHAGDASLAVFAGLHGVTAAPLFVAGLDGADTARRILEAGPARLCVERPVLNEEDMREEMAGYARLLGRCL